MPPCPTCDGIPTYLLAQKCIGNILAPVIERKSSSSARVSFNTWWNYFMVAFNFYLVSSIAVCKETWTTSKFQLPRLSNLFRLISSLSVCRNIKNFPWTSLKKSKLERPVLKILIRLVADARPNILEFQYQTHTLLFPTYRYMVNKSISHSWIILFRLSSKHTQSHGDKAISSFSEFLKSGAMP